MKIRNPTIIKWIGFLGAALIRVWIGTLAYRQRSLGANVYPSGKDLPGPCIYVFWHENILVPCCSFARGDIHVLISEHADGEMITQVCQRLGYGTIRGSQRRGGAKAMRHMIRASKHNHIAIMPDGPRGPRRQVKMGLIQLAAKTGLPIVLVGVGHDRPWRLKSWDQFVLPRPWSKSALVSLDPIPVPKDADRAQLENYRLHVEKALNDVTDYAARLASR